MYTFEKINDWSDWSDVEPEDGYYQMEYLDQITLGEGNSYQLTIRPKEDPSDTTGDFVVSLAVEGATRLVNVGEILAPRVGYQVVFQANGERISEQIVWQNENAVVPPAPEGYEFEGWDAEKVTGDMVVHAVYRARTYTVTFVFPDGTEETRQASYGQGVIPPDTRYIKAPANMSVTGWSTDVTWWEVTEDMTVYPVCEYEKTAAAPYAFVTYADDEDETGEIVLCCDNEDADIYYTTDGTEPILDSAAGVPIQARDAGTSGTFLYTEPIPVTENRTIRAIAVVDNMNVSETAALDFDQDADALPEEPQYAESITLNRTEVTLTVGDSVTLQASVLPKTISSDAVFWESSDPSVAEVSPDGLVTAKKAGSCTVTATACAVNQISAACTLTVTEQQGGNGNNSGNTAEITSLKKPASVKAEKYGKKKIRLRWKKVEGATRYRIYRAVKKKGKYTCIRTIKKGKTVTFVDGSVKKGKTYYYKIRAYRTSGGKTIASAYSKIVRCRR
ncbi:MAG: Ig-like domain-containing protein [Hominisplanchenecus sp.]